MMTLASLPRIYRPFGKFAVLLAAVLALALTLQGAERPVEQMRYLNNGVVKVGVDLALGGAITFLSREGGENIINNYDLGRQAQLSFYSGPIPYVEKGKEPSEHWKHLGWNPIQAGDDWKHGSKVLDYQNDGHRMYVKCVPMQWPLDDVPGECTFETWLELDGPVVMGKGRLNNQRSDKTQYPAREQELPAVYANAPFYRVVSYTGSEPFAGKEISEIPKSKTKHPWTRWIGTEGWAALLDQKNRGLGLITPGHVDFTGGFAGKPGPNDTHGVGTGYLAGQGLEILDPNIQYDFTFELLPGNLEEIRARAAQWKPTGLPRWTFAKDRQGWHYIHAIDRGWPIKDALDVVMEQPDPQMLSPLCFWRADDAPYVVIEAAYHTSKKDGTIYWQRHGDTAPMPDAVMNFPINADEQFHRYVVKLKDAPHYQGPMILLRFDPIPDGGPGEWVKVKSIQLSASGD